MKLAADVHPDLPYDLIEAMNRLQRSVKAGVIDAFLEVIGVHDTRGWGPAEFYVQQCQYGYAQDLFVRVELSGVSVGQRKIASLKRARERLEKIYADLIKRYVPKGTLVQLQVVIMVDTPVREELLAKSTSLLETPPGKIWVMGEYDPKGKPFQSKHLVVIK